MRRICSLIPLAYGVACAMLAGTALAGDALRLSEPVRSTSEYEEFGAVVPEGNAVSLADLLENADHHVGKPVRVAANVAQVCQKKGCFFIAREGSAVARVTFIDYSFFVPTDAAGRDAVMVGVLEKRELNTKQARHYAEDAGQDPSTIEGPVFEYHIIASAVRLSHLI